MASDEMNTMPEKGDLEDDNGYSHGLSTVRWVDRKPQVLNLCKELWPSASKHDVVSRFVGSYNETIPITITPSDSENATEFILRIPNQWSETPVMESVATLHYIRSSTPIRVPDIVAYDTTASNAVESPYIIMERLGGTDLDDTLDDLTPDQRVIIAGELAQLYTQLRQVRSAHSGRIIPAPSFHLPSLLPGETLPHIPIAIEPIGARTDPELMTVKPPTAEIDGTPDGFVANGGMTSDPRNLPLAEVFSRAFNRRIVQQATWFPRNKPAVRQYETLRAMAAAIVSEGRVGNKPDTFCLWHSDLFPRNIMVDVRATPMITGIIDWDEAVFVPAFAAAVAPAWLWEPGPRYDEDGECLGGSGGGGDEEETVERSNRVPESEQMREVKRVFEEAAGDEYRATCGDPYAIIGRRLLRFAVVWQWPDWWFDAFDETIDEWYALRYESPPENESEAGSGGEVEDLPEDDGDSAWETCYEDGEDEEDDGDNVWRLALERGRMCRRVVMNKTGLL